MLIPSISAISQHEVEEIHGIPNYRLQQCGQTARERDELHNQLMNLTIESDEAAQELDRVTHHRDASLELEEEEYPEEVLGVSDVDSDHFDE